MKPNLVQKGILIGTVFVFCLVGLLCFRKGVDGKTQFSFPTSARALKENLGDRISLGLDLRGGMHLILQVQVDEAINIETDQLADRLPTLLREQGINLQKRSCGVHHLTFPWEPATVQQRNGRVIRQGNKLRR